ncbi:MAG: plastocyanin/azurin family copper-binding protein [Gemmatimonadaceae bacterium]
MFSPPTVTISVNGTVQWQITGERHNVTFTGAVPPGGSIPDVRDVSVSRTFATEGTYNYECTRHSDKGMIGTVIVQAPQPQQQTFSGLTLTPSSASLAVGAQIQLTATPVDQNGFAIQGAPSSAFSSSASGVASVSASGLVTGISAGSATISASLTIAGVSRTSTADFTIAQTSAPPAPPPPPPSASITVTTPGVSFSPQTATIPINGSVTWQISGATHNVTFSGAAPPGGNIPDARDVSVTRNFPLAGSYSYQCTRHSGMTGSVIVQ